MRIQISVCAYAYEIADNPLVSDTMWDWLVTFIDPWLMTSHPVMDEFFLRKFSPHTGFWIHEHPELEQIKQIYTRYMRAVGPILETKIYEKFLQSARAAERSNGAGGGALPHAD